MLALVGATHAAALATAWRVGGALRLRAADRVAFLMCSTQKTLALGLPLLLVVFQGRSDLAVLCTPLLLQHPLQLIVGSLLTSRLARAVAEDAPPS